MNKNILITPNITGLDDPIIEFLSENNTSIFLKVLPNGSISFEDSNGQILGINSSSNGPIVSIKTNLGIPVLEVLNSGLIKLAEHLNNVLIGTNIDNSIDKLQVDGTITHKGLSLSSGTNIDQVVTITKTLTLINNWMDVGISADDLLRGTYVIQLYANDISVGGSNDNEYYSGIMSWYDSIPNSTSVLPTDEISLHRSGGSSGDTGIFLRTYRTNSDKVKLQIFSLHNNMASSNYIFSFRRLI